MKELKVSMIIPTYKREQALCDTISDLLVQDYADFEIVVVDQTKKHKRYTEKFLEKMQDKIRYFKLKKAKLTLARNFAIRVARGDIIIFVDDDIRIPSVKFIRHYVENFKDQSIQAVTGKVSVINSKLQKNKHGQAINIKPYGEVVANYHANEKEYIMGLYGGNMAFRREVFEKAGGFEERLRGACLLEDNDFAKKLYNQGIKILFEPAALVIHLEQKSGGGRSVDRISWYFDFFHNTFLFFLKNCRKIYLPVYFWKKARAILACIFWYGKVTPRALITPLGGFISAYKSFKEYKINQTKS